MRAWLRTGRGMPMGREDIPVGGSTGLGKWLVPGDE